MKNLLFNKPISNLLSPFKLKFRYSPRFYGIRTGAPESEYDKKHNRKFNNYHYSLLTLLPPVQSVVCLQDKKETEEKLSPERIKLSHRLCGHARAPEQALRAGLEGIILELEKISNTKFDSDLQQKLWEFLEKEKLPELREKLIFNVCEKMLKSLTEEQISYALEQHTEKNVITDILISAKIQTAYQLEYDNIVNDIALHAKLILNDPNILEMLFNIVKNNDAHDLRLGFRN